MVYATTFLAYPKDHVFALRPTCIPHIVITLSFPESFTLFPHIM